MKAAIILHFGNNAQLNEMKKYIYRFIRNSYQIEFDIYISIVKELVENVDYIENEFNKISKCKFFYYKNKGADIGPFLLIIDHLIENKLNYEFIIKLHTKTNNKWRKELINPLISRLGTIKTLFNESDIGLCCAKKWLFDIDNLNEVIVTNLCEDWNIKVDWYDELYSKDEYDKIKYEKEIDNDVDINFFVSNNPIIYNTVRLTSFNTKKGYRFIERLLKCHENLPTNKHMIKTKRCRTIKFVAGTIFAIKYDILVKFIKDKKINVRKIFDNMKEGYFTDEGEGTITHALERIIGGVMLDHLDKKIVGL